MTQILLKPAALLRLLVGIPCTLALASLTVNYAAYATETHKFVGLKRLFNMDGEWNIPAWYSVVCLFVAAALLALITAAKTQAEDRFARHWYGLTLLFLLLSLDEGSSLHEMVGQRMNMLMHWSGFFAFAWVVPALGFLGLFGLAYIRFLRHLPPPIECRFLLAAAVYLCGAVGFEMLSARFLSARQADFTYAALSTSEELLEMLGIALWIHALAEYCADYAGGIVLHRAQPEQVSASAAGLSVPANP